MKQNPVLAFAKLTRIEHSLMLVIAVIAAELIVGGLPALQPLLLSVATPVLISMGAFAINDYYDVEADKVNKRFDRPIVSGAVSRGGAYKIAVVCLVVGAAISFFINIYAFVIAVVFSMLSYLYSYRLKDTLLLGNMYVAASMVIPFVYGNFVVSAALDANIILISFVVFLTGLAREIHGMIRDRRGDQKARSTNNLVRYVGVQKSALFAFTLYVVGIGIAIIMFIFKYPFKYNLIYIAPITVVNLMLFYVAAGYLTIGEKGNSRFFKLSRNLSLGAMGLAVLTYLVSAVWQVLI